MDVLRKLFGLDGRPKLMFHGAAQTVTGSMHLLRLDGHTVSLDCGMFQGRRRDARKRNTEFPIPPAQIDALLLSHAHIDHSGRIPHLTKNGFTGRIYAT
ncbi:MAG: MBL fold metallo-hydrolase, partial [Phycisphaerae bacterium]|nr:MBL fold metallo-hydrolase [Phycisphaerae bacterium]